MSFKRSVKTFLKDIQKLHGASPHNILLFIGAGYKDNTWRLHAEVVEQSDVKSTIEKRRIQLDLFELPECRSPSLSVKRIKKIKVTLGSNDALCLIEGRQVGEIVINIISGGEDNFVSFPVRRTSKDSMATIHFKALGGRGKLHTAFFDPRQLNRYASNFTHDIKMSAITPNTISGSERPLPQDLSVEKYKTTATPDSLISSFESASALSEEEKCDFFDGSSMLCLARQISSDQMWEVSVCLRISDATYQDLERECLNNQNKLKLRIINHWLGSSPCSDQKNVSHLRQALKHVGLERISDIVDRVFQENRALKPDDFHK